MSSPFGYDYSTIPAKIYYKNLSEVFRPEFGNLDAESFGLLMEQMNIDPEYMEFSLGSLKNIGKAATKVLPQVIPVAAQVIPVAAPILGAAIGGPVGAKLGQAAGDLAVKAISPNSPGIREMGIKALTQVIPAAAPILGGVVGSPTIGQAASSMLSSSPAASKLLQAMLDPKMITAINTMRYPPQVGAQSISVGSKMVDLPRFTNLLGQLALQATAEYIAFHGESSPLAEDYEATVGDPTESYERAMELFEDLQKANADDFSPYSRRFSWRAASEVDMGGEAYDDAYDDEDALFVEYYSNSEYWR